MISIAAVDEKDIAAAQEKLFPVVGEITEWDWLWHGVNSGFYQATEVRRNGVAQYRYFWHLNDQRFLNVNASVFVGAVSDRHLWVLGAHMIAANEKARGIICTTNRRGHVEECERMGFKILGVRLFKEIDL